MVQLTLAICEYAQKYLGVEVLMHLSLSGMTVEALRDVLHACKSAGIQNILALRGDPPKVVEYDANCQKKS